ELRRTTSPEPGRSARQHEAWAPPGCMTPGREATGASLIADDPGPPLLVGRGPLGAHPVELVVDVEQLHRRGQVGDLLVDAAQVSLVEIGQRWRRLMARIEQREDRVEPR